MQHYSQVFRVGHVLGPVFVQHSLTSCPSSTRFTPWNGSSVRGWFGPDPAPVWVHVHVRLNGYIQRIIRKELLRCFASKAFCHEVYRACSSASPPGQLFSQSPQHRGRIAQCSLLFQPFSWRVHVAFFVFIHVEVRVCRVCCATTSSGSRLARTHHTSPRHP